MKIIKKAFTLLELVLVIVILGIIGLIATEVISNVYTSYIISQRINALESKTEFFLEQVANRLQYRIKDSTIGKNPSDDNDYKKLDNILENEVGKYKILEWIPYSYEALNGGFIDSDGDGDPDTNRPGYTALIDVENSDTNSTQFITSGSRLKSIARDILYDLSNGDTDLNSTNLNKSGAIFFATIRPKEGYWSNAQNSNTSFAIYAKNDKTLETIDVQRPSGTVDIYERYYLAWSAYAIVPVESGKNCNKNYIVTNDDEAQFDLCLYYNFQPWQGENYKDAKEKTLLMESVTSFRFKSYDTFLRMKVCVNDNNTTGSAYNVQKNGRSAFGFCKEKALF